MRILRTWSRGVLAMAIIAMAVAPLTVRGQAGGGRVDARPKLINDAAERAIERGLAYLGRTQGRDGSWRSGSRYGLYPCTMTSLAGLGLMAGGNTPVEGEYAKNVRLAVDYVLSCAQPTGLIARSEEQRPMYGHGFGMLFLAEAYGMEQDARRQQRIKRVLEKAVELTGRSQSKDGGWLYTPDSNGDEGSVTITQIQGLRAARNAGIKVPKKIIDRAIKYIENSANADGGIRYTARQREGTPARPPITAAAVAVLYNAGDYDNPVAFRALNFINKLYETNRSQLLRGHKFYTMLYLAQAKYLSVGATDAQGRPLVTDEDWQAYFIETRDDLVRTQSGDGSWQGDSVGTTYGTAIALMTLQLPYRYLPILQR